MKVVSPDILHKSEHGGVIVGIRDEAAARAVFQTIRERVTGADFRGVVIYPMMSVAQEVLVGLSRDSQFGPVIAFGLGGIYTEVLRDVALRVAPIGRIEAAAMIRSIRAFPTWRRRGSSRVTWLRWPSRWRRSRSCPSATRRSRS